jgi:hypothetical protein
MTRTATGRAETTRADRYLAQLCDHLEHMRHGAGPDHQPSGHGGAPDVQLVERMQDGGVIVFDWGTCTLRASPDALAVQIEAADNAALTRAQALIGHRIETIGRRENLTVTWLDPGPLVD